MQPHMIPDPLVNESSAARRASWLLMVIAGAALLGDCLLNSPAKFSEAHSRDTSLLKPVVEFLALDARWPTARGVEIRDLFFYVGAAVLTFLAGFRLLTSGAASRLGLDDVLDFRRRASSPYFWWCILLVVSAVSSVFSHAPDMCKGQTIIRFMHLAWWWPLAALLIPSHARKLAGWLTAVLAAVALVALWYHLEREQPRLRYPIGNELFLAACLLPGLFLVVGFAGGWLSKAPPLGASPIEEADASPPRQAQPGEASPSRPGWLYLLIPLLCIAALALLAALYFTRSRSAGVGMAAGLVAVVFMVVEKKQRSIVVLVAALLAIGGALYLQNLRVSGVAGERAHSIRARLDHEWPYALAMFLDKPVAGHGDGAYSMLAGQMARAEQLEDPAILSTDEGYWEAHAHNEFLELLADLGFVGMFAFCAAFVLTIVYAMRFSERLRADPGRNAERWLVIGLAGALVAILFEECSDVALHKPGLPPIFLTVWALLWAMVRTERPVVAAAEATDDETTFRVSAMRIAGTLMCVAAVVLGLYGVRNWKAVRAQYETTVQMQNKDFVSAIRCADYADEQTLDPFQRLLARFWAVWARSLEFDGILSAGDAPPTNADLEVAREAMVRLDALSRVAPRFIRASRLEADLALNLSRAHERRNESTYARDYLLRFQKALEQHRADEPFRIDAVMDLWKVKPDATALERLDWLRCLLRNGGISADFITLFQDLVSRPDFEGTMHDLMNVALQDALRPPESWKDNLTPETFRIAALDRAMRVDMSEDAAKLAAQAEVLYRKAGPRLFAAHSAALHEVVRYRFAGDPTANTDQNLALLAQAQTIFAAPADAKTALPDDLGETRLRVLLAAGRENEAAAQIRLLQPEARESLQQELADGYVGIAAQFAQRSDRMETAMGWARRAVELAPQSADAYGMMTSLLLKKGDDDAALDTAEEYLKRESDGNIATRALSALERHYPGSTMWAELRRRHPGLLSVPIVGPEAPPADEPVPGEPAGGE